MITAIVMTALLAVIAAATVTTGRYWAVAAALAGLAAASLSSDAFSRTRRWRALGWTVGVVGLGFGGAMWPAVLVAQPHSAPAASAVPVFYSGSGQLDDGKTLMLREEIVLADAVAVPPSGWTPIGASSFVRTRSITPRSGTPVRTDLTIPLELGTLPIGGGVPLAIGDGSRIVLTLPQGALGGTAPASIATRVGGDHLQVTTIPVGRDVTGVSVTVLSDIARSRPGHRLYRVLAWEPLPWVVGIMVALVSSVLWDRLLRLVLGPALVRRRGMVVTRAPGVGT